MEIKKAYEVWEIVTRIQRYEEKASILSRMRANIEQNDAEYSINSHKNKMLVSILSPDEIEVIRDGLLIKAKELREFIEKQL